MIYYNVISYNLYDAYVRIKQYYYNIYKRKRICELIRDKKEIIMRFIRLPQCIWYTEVIFYTDALEASSRIGIFYCHQFLCEGMLQVHMYVCVFFSLFVLTCRRSWWTPSEIIFRTYIRYTIFISCCRLHVKYYILWLFANTIYYILNRCGIIIKSFYV